MSHIWMSGWREKEGREGANERGRGKGVGEGSESENERDGGREREGEGDGRWMCGCVVKTAADGCTSSPLPEL